MKKTRMGPVKTAGGKTGAMSRLSKGNPPANKPGYLKGK